MRKEFLFSVLLILTHLTAFAGEPNINSNDPYERLGIESSADVATVQKAYRKLAMKWHPDRVDQADKAMLAEHEANFKKVKEAYDFISGKVSKMTESTEQSPKAKSADSSKSYNFTNEDFAKSYKTYGDSNPFGTKKQNSQSSGLYSKETIFGGSIVNMFVNESGVIVEILSTISGNNGFYWKSNNSNTFYQLHLGGTNGVSGGGRYQELDSTVIDPKYAPEGMPFIIRGNALFVGRDLVFKSQNLSTYEAVDREYYQAGYTAFVHGGQQDALNEWTYNIYKDHSGKYYVIATQYAKHTYRGRLFVGWPGKMREVPVTFDKQKRTFEWTAKHLTLSFSSRRPDVYIDKLSNLFMGFVDKNTYPLQLLDSNGQLFEEIPALEKSQHDTLSLVRLLGEMIEPPVQLETPVELIFNKPKDKSTLEDKVHGRDVPAKERAEVPARIINNKVLKEHLNFPKDDPRAQLASLMVNNSDEISRMMSLIDATRNRSDVYLFLSKYFAEEKDISNVTKFSPLMEEMLRDLTYGQAMSFAMTYKGAYAHFLNDHVMATWLGILLQSPHADAIREYWRSKGWNEPVSIKPAVSHSAPSCRLYFGK